MNGAKRRERRVTPQTAKSSRDNSTLEEYFSIRHPDYRKAESEFVGFNWSYVPTGPGHDDLDRLDERLRDNAEAESAVFDAIEWLGLSALRCTEEPFYADDTSAAFHLHVHDICCLVWEHVERWYNNARYAATVADRARAAKLLKRLGSTLAGSRKGKRKKIVTDPFQVWIHYRRTLFRLQLARRLLKVWPWARSQEEKFASVADAYGLPVQDFLTYRNVSTKWFARFLTGNEFGIAPETVANILSASQRSRK
ncbi:MAG: hypothetical protein ACHQ9S_07265 [Candidatus Binatia bacterium]